MNVYALLRPLLFTLPADAAHDLAIRFARFMGHHSALLAILERRYDFEHPALAQQHLGLRFPNPVGMAAGFDKNGRIVPFLQALGFGFIELGSITARASPGNPRPRCFRLVQDRSLINRMGLNNDGAAAVVARLKTLTNRRVPLGVNIAKTHDPKICGQAALDDYRTSFDLAREVADYITVNISCPNTAEGKTFEEPTELERLLRMLELNDKRRTPPVLIKLSADLQAVQLREILAVCEGFPVAGYVAVNTSAQRDKLVTAPARVARIGRGGLSGQAIRQRSTRIIREIAEFTGGRKTLIGVGGISSPEHAIEKLEAGAHLLQLYTGMIYEGPGVVLRIKRAIADYLAHHPQPPTAA